MAAQDRSRCRVSRHGFLGSLQNLTGAHICPRPWTTQREVIILTMPLSLNIQGYTIFWKHLYRRTYLPLEPSSVSGRSHLALGSSVRAWMPGNGICVISFQGSGKAYFPVTVLQVPPSAAVSCSKLIKAPQVLSHTGSCHFLKP